MTLAPSANGLLERPQAFRAYKQLLRYIRMRRFQPGDLLPPQPVLCQELGLCNNTINAAMAVLVDAGALTRKKRVGTAVVDLRAASPTWSVGVLTIRPQDQTPGSFYAELFLRVQSALGDAGCRCLSYRSRDRKLPAKLSGFFGLIDDLSYGQLDGILTLTPLDPKEWQDLAARGVAACHTHWWERSPCGVLVDERAMAEQGVAHMAGRGCRKLALVAEDARFGIVRLREGFERGLNRAGLSLQPENLLKKDKLPKAEMVPQLGSRIAAELLQRPTGERPDGVIVADDHVAMGLAETLRHTSDYRPQIVVQTNRQSPLHFALPVIRFVVDIEELAQRSARLLLERIENPGQAEQVEWMVPVLGGAEAMGTASLSVG